MQTNKLLEEGGILQEGGTVDPVSGNDVPVGSLQEEVRDDLDVKLSEGEFVIPADVVRYIGLERLMQLRDEAKKGLARMAEIGQMGNAQEVENPDQLHSAEEGEEEEDDDFDSVMDEIISEVDAEAIGAKPQKFADGGVVGTTSSLPPAPRPTGSGPMPMLSKYGVPTTSVSNPALDVRVYENAQGSKMFITFINGKPLSPIPTGFTYSGQGTEFGNPPATEFTNRPTPAPTPAPTTAPAADGGAGGAGGAGGGAGGDSAGGGDSGTTGGTTGSTGGGVNSDGSVSTGIGGISVSTSGVASPNTTGLNSAQASVLGALASVVTGLPLGMIANTLNTSINNAATAAALGFNTAVSDTTTPANIDTSTPAAVAGPAAQGGTGGAAANAASNAASAAAAAGHSPEAQGAASQAAANATVNGASPAAAAAAGAVAAVAADSQGSVDANVSDQDAANTAAQAEADAAAAAIDANSASTNANAEAAAATGHGAADLGAVDGPPGGGGGDSGSSGSSSDGSGCIDPATSIFITSTETKRASDIKVGDTVFTVHEKTLEYGTFKVVAAEIIQQPKLLVTFNDKSEMKVSDTHKFLLTDGSWKEMYLLDQGAQIKAAEGVNREGFKTIVNIEELGTGDVVMLTVEDAHTYIADGLISHNMKARGGLVVRKKKTTKMVQKGLAARK